MLTPQEELARETARLNRENMPAQEAVTLLLKDTDLESREDAEEWLQIMLKRRVSLETGPGRVDYDELLKKAKDGTTKDLWFERNKYHPVPFAARHIADSTGMCFADALRWLRMKTRCSLYLYDQNGELGFYLSPWTMTIEEWKGDGLLIDVYEFVRILNNGEIALPDGWPEWLKQPSYAALVEAERARMAEREEAPAAPHQADSTNTTQEGSPAPTETPKMTGTVATGTEEAKKKPGRPANTDYAAIEAEMRRRFENDEELQTLKEESNQLETWSKNRAKQQVPTGKPSAAGQIRKRFRDLYKTLESAKIEKKKTDEMTK